MFWRTCIQIHLPKLVHSLGITFRVGTLLATHYFFFVIEISMTALGNMSSQQNLYMKYTISNFDSCELSTKDSNQIEWEIVLLLLYASFICDIIVAFDEAITIAKKKYDLKMTCPHKSINNKMFAGGTIRLQWSAERRRKKTEKKSDRNWYVIMQ